MSIDTVAPPAPLGLRLREQVLSEIAVIPIAAASLWGLTAFASFGALWSERFPLNSGTVIAWSLHSHWNNSSVFRPLSGVMFAFFLLLGAAVAWALSALAAQRGRLAVSVALAGAFVLPVLAVLPPAILSEDTASYWAYGRIACVYNGNPFVVSPLMNQADHPDPSFFPVAEVWQDMPSNYGPGFVWTACAVAKVSGTSFPTAVRLFKLIGLAGVLAVSALIAFGTRRLPAEERSLRLVLWGWNPIVTLYLVGGGHNDALMAVGLGLAGLGVLKRRHWAVFGGIAIAALMKPVAIVAAPIYGLWLWMNGESKGTAVVGTVGSSLALVAAYAPYWEGTKTFDPLRRIAYRVEDALPVGWLSSPTSHLFGNDGAHTLARMLSLLALVAMGLWIVRHLDVLGPLEAIALAFAAVLLASTYTQPWYLVWVIVPMAFAGRSSVERWWRPMVLLCAIWTVKAVRNQPRFDDLKGPARHFESLVHWLQGGLTLLLILAVLQALRQRRAERQETPFPELVELERAMPPAAG